VYPPTAARQWLSKNITMPTNTQATKEMLDVIFYAVHVVSRTVGNQFFPEILVNCI
jgi:hypothetical protein